MLKANDIIPLLLMLLATSSVASEKMVGTLLIPPCELVALTVTNPASDSARYPIEGLSVVYVDGICVPAERLLDGAILVTGSQLWNLAGGSKYRVVQRVHKQTSTVQF